jgi:hypothetical protein
MVLRIGIFIQTNFVIDVTEVCDFLLSSLTNKRVSAISLFKWKGLLLSDEPNWLCWFELDMTKLPGHHR